MEDWARVCGVLSIHQHKDTKFFKILKFGVYQAVRDTAIQKLQNLKGNDIQDNPYNYFKVRFVVRF